MNKIVSIAVVAVVVGGAAFFAGTNYGKAQNAGTIRGQNNGPGQLTAEERQIRLSQFGGRGGQGVRNAGGFAAGEILFKDDTSVTVKLREGGSKIIFLSDTTQIMKSVAGSTSDLAVGKEITVMGAANPDGSVTADSVQLRTPRPASQNP